MTRPTTYSQEIADKICERISLGDTIKEIVVDPEMPDYKIINKWRAENSYFFRQFCTALQDQALFLIDRINQHQYDLKNGFLDAKTAKVLIDTDKWLASKFYPSMFGDKLVTENRNITADYEKSSPFTEQDLENFREMGWKV
jgi:hypothetical protein